MSNIDLVPCPVCGTNSFTKENFPGSYEICEVCGWEDDSVQFDDPDFEGGANDPSLNQARINFKKRGKATP